MATLLTACVIGALSPAPRHNNIGPAAAVDEPKTVTGAGERAADGDALQISESGWLYDAGLKGVAVKLPVTDESRACEMR